MQKPPHQSEATGELPLDLVGAPAAPENGRHPLPADGLLDFEPPAPDALSPAAGAPPTGDAPPGEMDGGPPPPPPDDLPFRALMDRNFLSYASYVIRDRAIPALEDGLKPVQRRILHTLHINDDGKFIKVANIVGDCMKFHPHGDASIGDALVALAQKRYLIDQQGNFGNIYTGDPAAAARYIECRLTDLARHEIFNDKLTNFIPSYDGRNKEPVTLPCKLPLLLMLGAEGIAVGLSTRILPHNFCELIEAQIAILQKQPFNLLPDFTQGGLMDASGYAKGIGRIRLRAVIHPKEHLAGTLVIRELPAGTTTDSLIASIEDAVRKKKLRIKSIDDFTAENVEIEIKLSPGEDPEKTIAALYLFTECEQVLSARPVIIRGDRPVELDVDEVLRVNTEQLVALLKAELELRRDDLIAGIHQKTLAQIFIENRIYKNIERCRSAEAVHSAVLDGVNQYRAQLRRGVSSEDVEMLLGLRIRRISLFDIGQNQREIDDLVAQLGETEKSLKGLTRHAINYLKNLLKTYGKEYPRRTKVTTFAEADARELAVKNLAIAYDPVRGYLGYGVKGDGLEPAFRCSELDRILIVAQDGRYKVVPPPEKLFVDRDLFHFAIFDREAVYTLVYGTPKATYLKRFAFGGTILNKEYRCAPLKSRLALLTAEPLERVYIKYKPLRPKRPGGRQPRSKEALTPDEQVEELANVPLQTPKTLGLLISHKPVDWLKTTRPRGWNENSGPAGGELGL
jgi:topoisomerase-4 subunit A